MPHAKIRGGEQLKCDDLLGKNKNSNKQVESLNQTNNTKYKYPEKVPRKKNIPGLQWPLEIWKSTQCRMYFHIQDRDEDNEKQT